MVNYTNYTTGERRTTILRTAQCLRDKNEKDVVFIGDDNFPAFMIGRSVGFDKLQKACRGRKRPAPWPGIRDQLLRLKLLRGKALQQS